MTGYRIPVETVSEGLHPSFAFVCVRDSYGKLHETECDRESIVEGTIPVSFPVGRDVHKGVLVELPRETVAGFWRIWVREADLIEAR